MRLHSKYLYSFFSLVLLSLFLFLFFSFISFLCVFVCVFSYPFAVISRNWSFIYIWCVARCLRSDRRAARRKTSKNNQISFLCSISLYYFSFSSFVRGECFINCWCWWRIFDFFGIRWCLWTIVRERGSRCAFWFRLIFFHSFRFVCGENCPSIILMLCHWVFTFISIVRLLILFPKWIQF